MTWTLIRKKAQASSHQETFHSLRLSRTNFILQLAEVHTASFVCDLANPTLANPHTATIIAQ